LAVGPKNWIARDAARPRGPPKRLATLDERNWQTGMAGSSRSQASLRARRAGTFTVWRSFSQSATSRWMWADVIPYASVTDAGSIVPTVLLHAVPNRRARVTVTEEREVEGQQVPGVTNSWVYEQLTTGLPNGPGAASTSPGTWTGSCSWLRVLVTWMRGRGLKLRRSPLLKPLRSEGG
jgi:hypothetical protein